MTKPICTIPECPKEAHTLARGWCINHDRRWKQYGDPLGGRAAYGGKDPICIIPGCDKNEFSRGWCSAHYNRWRLHGDPLAGRISEGEAAEYFWRTVGTEKPGECLVWPYGTTVNGGYGRFQVDGVRYRVHALACVVAYGPRPRGMIATHGPCHNPACYSSEHVTWDTPKKNMEHRKRDGTMLYGEDVVQSKLTADDVRAIRAAREAGVSRIVLAEKYGVHVEHIGLIATRRSWRHLP